VDRVLISGISGSGKTTVAKALEVRLGLPRHELDALHHGPGWVKRPEFEADVAAFADAPRWVTEDQYTSLLGDHLWQRADTVVWLDLPRATVMRQVVRRTLRRAATREELWNGNRESVRDWLDPEHPVRWAWKRHAEHRERTAARIAAYPQVRVVRLTSSRAARAWAAGAGMGVVTGEPR
jgi:adenylate kinase family enzyme